MDTVGYRIIMADQFVFLYPGETLHLVRQLHTGSPHSYIVHQIRAGGNSVQFVGETILIREDEVGNLASGGSAITAWYADKVKVAHMDRS